MNASLLVATVALSLTGASSRWTVDRVSPAPYIYGKAIAVTVSGLKQGAPVIFELCLPALRKLPSGDEDITYPVRNRTTATAGQSPRFDPVALPAEPGALAAGDSYWLSVGTGKPPQWWYPSLDLQRGKTSSAPWTPRRGFARVGAALAFADYDLMFAGDGSEAARYVMVDDGGDVPFDHWAFDAVSVLLDRAIVKPLPDGRFDGCGPMTRDAVHDWFEAAHGVLAKAGKPGEPYWTRAEQDDWTEAPGTGVSVRKMVVWATRLAREASTQTSEEVTCSRAIESGVYTDADWIPWDGTCSRYLAVLVVYRAFEIALLQR